MSRTHVDARDTIFPKGHFYKFNFSFESCTDYNDFGQNP